jgi:hypothetical protein
VDNAGRLRFISSGVVLAALVAINLYGLFVLAQTADVGRAGDWAHMNAVDPHAPYDNDYFRWAPPALWLWRTFVAPLGFGLWLAAHLGALLLLRDPVAICVALLSWPFWSDALNGSTLTFVVVSAALALGGSRLATGTYVLLLVLAPRPLMVPVLAVVLYRQRFARFALAAGGVAVFVASALSGQLDAWVLRLVESGPSEIESINNIGPSLLMGPWWLLVGVPLGVWLTLRRYPGAAGLAVSPYWLSYYLLMPLADLYTKRRPPSGTDSLEESDTR